VFRVRPLFHMNFIQALAFIVHCVFKRTFELLGYLNVTSTGFTDWNCFFIFGEFWVLNSTRKSAIVSDGRFSQFRPFFQANPGDLEARHFEL
jgi:hypothetical protein